MKIEKKIKSKKTNVGDEEYKKRNIYLLTSQMLSYNSEICKYLLRDTAFIASDILRRQLSDKIKDYLTLKFFYFIISIYYFKVKCATQSKQKKIQSRLKSVLDFKQF
jgi:hypothetical protein